MCFEDEGLHLAIMPGCCGVGPLATVVVVVVTVPGSVVVLDEPTTPTHT